MDLSRWMEPALDLAPRKPGWTVRSPRTTDPARPAHAITLAEEGNSVSVLAAYTVGRDATGQGWLIAASGEQLDVDEPRQVTVATEPVALVDLLDADAVRNWLRQSVPAPPDTEEHPTLLIRLDLADVFNGDRLPWSPTLPALWREKYENDDLLQGLPLLWLDGQGADVFRWRYHNLVAQTFHTACLKTLAEFAAENGWRLRVEAGDFDSLGAEIFSGCGPLMRLVDGSEPVVRDPGAGMDSTRSIKEAVSLARQTGRPSAAAILFSGREGRQNALADLCAFAERDLALGIGELVLPDGPMELRGENKRRTDAISTHATQPWQGHWDDKIAPGLARLVGLLRQGTSDTSVLVLTPSDSLMACAAASKPLGGEANPSVETAQLIERQFEQTLDALLGGQIDFELADEEVIARHGRTRTNTFYIGEAEYDVVVVPPAVSWRKTTMRLIERFSKRGGSVIASRPLAPCVDFEPDETLERLEDSYPNLYILDRAGRDVRFQINRVAPRPLEIRSKDQNTSPLWMRGFHDDTRDSFFVANTSPTESIETQAWCEPDGAIRVLDPWTPRILLKDAETDKGAQMFHFNFHARTATLLSVGGQADLTEAPHQRRPHASVTETLEESWDFERLDPNLLPLWECRALLNDAPIGDATLNRVQPLAFARATLDAQHKSEPGDTLHLNFRFDSQLVEGFGGALGLLVEPNPEMTVTCNGQEVTLPEEDWEIDPTFRRASLEGRLVPGENEIDIRCPWRPDAESNWPVVESPILTGDFGVSLDEQGRATLTAEPIKLRNGSWTDQGYPYYAGRMVYRQDIIMDMEERKRYFLRLPNPGGSAITARIEEHEPAWMGFAPWRLEITKLARSDINAIAIEVAGTLHNLFGPVHVVPRLADDPWADPAIYDAVPNAERRHWSRTPNLTPFGLLDGAVIETYDPDAPPPKKQKAKTTDEADAETQQEDEEPDQSE